MFNLNKLVRSLNLEVVHIKQLSIRCNTSSSATFPTTEFLTSEANRIEFINKLKTFKIATRTPPKKEQKGAAVLIPFCLIGNELSLLYTLRKSGLKRHSGQVSFPGGVKDDTDVDLEETALRETEEELGVDRHYINVWGSGPKIIGAEFTILPVVGYLGKINLDVIKPSPGEVEDVFTVTLKHLCDLKNCRFTQFRPSKDGGLKGYILPAYVNTKHRVWGMTALITHLVLMSLLPGHYKHTLKYYKPVTAKSIAG